MKRWTVFLLLTALMAGAFASWENFTQFLSLKNLRVRADDPVAEALFWQNLEPEMVRFWPLFLLRRENLRQRLEMEAPITVTIEREPLLSFTVEMKPLLPWLLLRWQERDFFLSRGGSIWKKDHPLNARLAEIQLPSSPPVILADSFPSPEGTLEEGQMVSKSIFPVETLAGWIDSLSSTEWFSRMEKLVISRREGQFLLEVFWQLQKKTVRLLFTGDRKRWSEIFSALSQILQQLQFSGEDIIIDTTYSDRIIVRSVQGRGKEGSGK